MLLTLATRCIELLEKTALCQEGKSVRLLSYGIERIEECSFDGGYYIYFDMQSNCEIEKCNEISCLHGTILASKTILHLLYFSKRNYLKVI